MTGIQILRFESSMALLSSHAEIWCMNNDKMATTHQCVFNEPSSTVGRM